MMKKVKILKWCKGVGLCDPYKGATLYVGGYRGIIAVANRPRRFKIHCIERNRWNLQDGMNQVAIFRTLKGAKEAARLVAFE